MSETPLNTQTLSNTKQILHLLKMQTKSGHIDHDFMLKQLEKIEGLFDQVEAYRQEQKSSGQFEALYQVSRLLGTSLDIQEVLDQVMDAIIGLTGAEAGFLMLKNEDGVLQVQAARNLDQETLGTDEYQYSRTIVNRVVDEGQAILTTNAAEDPRFASQASIVSQSMRSIMAVPLWTRRQTIGVAYAENRAHTGLFTPDDLAIFEALAGQAAIAIDNALLFEATDQRLATQVDKLSLLRRIDMQLSQTLDTEKIMQYTLEWACRASGASIGYFGEIEIDEDITPTIVYIAHHGVESENSTPQFNIEADLIQLIHVKETLSFTIENQSALAIPILRGEDTVVGVILLIRDDSGAFSEEEHDLAERIVARAGMTLENARLYNAVQAADIAKSEFVGIVAHDLKAPMTSIAGYAELILMDEDTLIDRQAEFLKRIRETVSRMEILVSDLADISRIESGHFLMQESEVQIKHVTQAVRDAAMPQIRERHHQYIEEIEENLPQLYVDYYRLVQVLVNLVSNAYKYTPNSGTITLRAYREHNRVVFSVSDTGVGLSEEAIHKIGTKFWRASDDYTRSQPGTGLGFAITRILVEQMGSPMEIESELAKGSTFRFSVATV